MDNIVNVNYSLLTKQAIEECYSNATKFLLSVYPYMKQEYFDALPVFIKEKDAASSCWCQIVDVNGISMKIPCHIKINMHPNYKIPLWYTYIRKACRLAAVGIEVSRKFYLSITLVHEFTHYIQYREGRKASEIETTKNEIEFARQFYYSEYYLELKTYSSLKGN